MKGKKLLAVILAALMVSSSVGVTAFEDDEVNSEPAETVEVVEEEPEENAEEAEAPAEETDEIAKEQEVMETKNVAFSDNGSSSVTTIEISTVAQFKDFIKRINSVSHEGETIILKNDIDLQNEVIEQGNGVFRGTFDGNGFTIKNFSMSKPLFCGNSGYGSIIKNFTLENVTLNNTTGDPLHLARLGLICVNHNGTFEDITIKNCKITSTVGTGVVGAFAAMTQVGSVTKNCMVDGFTVEIPDGATAIGGAFGLLLGDSTTTIESVSTKNVTINATDDTPVDSLFGADNESVEAENCTTDRELAVAKIGQYNYATLEAAMNSLENETGDIVIELKGTASYEFGAWTEFTKNYTGGTITFVGKDENRGTILNLHGTDTDHSAIDNATKLIFKNLTINKTNANDTGSAPYNRHALNILGEVEFEDVKMNNQVMVSSDASFKNVDFTDNNDQYVLFIMNSAENVTVENCSFKSGTGRAIKIADENISAENQKKVNLKVTGSTFESAKKAAVLITSNKGADITIDGNDISGVAADSEYFAWVDEARPSSADKITIRDLQGKIVNSLKLEGGSAITKTAVAEINGVEFADLQSAVDAAEDGDVIKLIADIVIDIPANILNTAHFDYATIDNKKLTVDFNGKQISWCDAAASQTIDKWDTVFALKNQAELTITGDGVVNGRNVGACNGCTAWLKTGSNSKLTIESGSFYGETILYINDDGGTITINGGRFENDIAGDGHQQTLNVQDYLGFSDNKKITMYGGTLVGDDPRFVNDGSMLPDDYTVSKSKNSNGINEYKVIALSDAVASVSTNIADYDYNHANNRTKFKNKYGYEFPVMVTNHYTTLADAIANANNGDTVTLLEDASGDGVIINKDITIDLNGKTYTLSGKAVGSPGYETSAFQLLADNVTFKNGTLTTAENVTCHNNERGEYTEKANMIIQNYSNLTLDNVTLDGTNLRDTGCTLSNNKGDVEIKDSTINTNGKTFAFDVDNSRGTDQTITVTNSTINGFVEISGNDGKDAKLVSGTNEYKENGTYVQQGDKFIKAAKRSLEIKTNSETAEMDDIIEVSVVIKGSNLVNAEFDVEYDTSLFELVSDAENSFDVDTANGKISEMLFKNSGTYANEETLVTYRFKAIGQDTDDVNADFKISNTNAFTSLESAYDYDIETTNNEKVSVVITRKAIVPELYLDNEITEESSAEFSYTGDAHTFEVVTNFGTVSYEYYLNDEIQNETPEFKNEGVYKIKYSITPNTGYAPANGEFTITIGNPVYVVEVNTNDIESDDYANYITNQKLVLVYTNVEGLAFKYNGKLMIDVTARGYKYNNQAEFRYVYAFVTDTIENGEISDYEAKVKHGLASVFLPKDIHEVPKYNEDLNFNGKYEMKDISTAFAVYNGDYVAEIALQRNMLKADTNGDKKVDGLDTAAVIEKVTNNRNQAVEE